MANAPYDMPARAMPYAPPASPEVENYLRFTQAGWSYLLPAYALIAAVSAEHVRPLRQRAPGWAGTLTVRGGMVPVLDGAELLGDGEAPMGVLLLRLPSGPLGIAVERLEGIDPLPYPGLLPVPGVLGVSGGLAAARDIPLALSLDYLDALRRIAVAPSADGAHRVPKLSWRTPQQQHSSEIAGPIETFRIGDPVVVLGERWQSDERFNLALPLTAVRVVARISLLRPVPPSKPGLVGLGAWGPRALPLLSLSGLDLVATSSAQSQLAIVLTNGIAILANGIRGAQGLTTLRSAPSGDQPFICALGETMGRRVAERISAEVDIPDRPSRGVAEPVRVAVISADRVRASLDG